ncbi:hypothetical protein BCR37DRAFT_388643 [Protomyces lactucae-debilis]|uniref:Uncharacterized protein n=1 Tax=Protomyces lactucae-debilis TaxID=2754530 RepID=A0A1Y2F583_PROLT|nr:uncharacterized protein BCR37DRAFT_388643 [Protomyces lactucae-debilis]ORY79042.1 hypothetical protein BCR37DRAFT_388643 [Protomyces lactucae-debilis]
MLRSSLLLFAATCFQEVYSQSDRITAATCWFGPTAKGVYIKQVEFSMRLNPPPMIKKKPGGVALRLAISRDPTGNGDFPDTIQSVAMHDKEQAACESQENTWCLFTNEYHSLPGRTQTVGKVIPWHGGLLKIKYYEDFKARTWNQTITDPRTGRVLSQLATPLTDRNMAMRGIGAAVIMMDCANPVVKAHSYHDIKITLSSPDSEFAKTKHENNCNFKKLRTPDRGHTWDVNAIFVNQVGGGKVTC